MADQKPDISSAEPTPTPAVDGDAFETPGGDGAAPTSTPPKQRSWSNRVLRGFWIVLAGILVLVTSIMLLLQTEFGRSRVQSIAVGQIKNLLSEDAEVEVGRLDGNFLTGARLTGFVIRQNGELAMTVDTVLVKYNLLTLLRSTFSADELYVGGPTVYLRQRADSTFNLATLLKPADPADTTASSFVVQMDQLALRRGRAEVRYYNPTRDSVLIVERLALSVQGFYSGPDSLSLVIDALGATAIAPDDEARITVAGGGVFAGNLLRLDDLRVASEAGTDILGTAQVAFDGGALPRLDADLAVQPLALADVRAFTGLELYGNPRVRLTAQTREDDLTFSMQGALAEGTISLDGTIEGARATSRDLRYRAEGQMRGINPAALTGNDALASDLNADLRVDLAGTSARTLDGPFSLTLTDSRVGERTIDRLALDGAFRTGRIEFDLDSAIPGATLRASGSARPFDPTPTYDVEGEADDVNLARLLSDPSQRTQFSGTFAVSGAGFTPERAVADAQVRLTDLRTGDLAFDYAGVDAELRGGLLRFAAETRVAGEGGMIEAIGEARPFARPLAYAVQAGQLTHLNVAALTGNPDQTSDLTGTFTLQGRGFDPQALDLTLQTSLRDSRYGEYDLVALDLDGALDNGTLTFNTDADLGRLGALTATGTAQPFSDPLTYQAQGRAEHLDLAELTGNPARQSDLTGAFVVDGRGVDPQTMAVTAQIDVEPSSYGAQDVTGGRLNLDLREGFFTLTGDLATPEGEFALDISGRPFDENPSFAFGEGLCFNNLDLATLLGNPDLRSRLTGCFRGTLTGLNPTTMTADGVVTLQPSTINDAEIESGEVDLTLRDGLLDATATLQLADGVEAPGGMLDLKANGRLFDERPTYTLSGTLQQFDVGAVAGLPTNRPARLSLAFEVDGTGTDPETMLLNGRIAGGRSKLGPASIDTLHTAFALDAGVLTLDTLALRSDLATADGGGRLVLTDRTDAGTSDLRLFLDVDNVAPLNAYLTQPLALADARFQAHIKGEAGGPLMLDVTAVAERLAYGTTAINGLDSRITGSIDTRDSLAYSLRSRVEFDFFSRPGLLVERGDLDVLYDGVDLTVDGAITVDRRRDLDFFVRVELDPDAPALVLERMRANVDGQPWTIAGPARITYGQAYRVENLLLQSADGEQQVAADGLIDPQGEQAFVLTAENLQTDGITDLLGYDGLGGRLTTTLLMTGPAENPQIDGTLDLDRFTSRNREVGSINVALSYADARLGLDARLSHITGKQLTAEGSLPLNFSLARARVDGETGVTEAAAIEPARFTVRSDSFPVAWVKPFLNPLVYSDVGGTLTADIALGGTQGSPELSGNALLENGRLGLVAVGRVYETITAPIRFLGNQALIENARITDPPGVARVTVDGSVTLPKLSVGELDLTITPNQFLATETETYDGLVLDRGTAPIHLTGTIENPVLRGSAVLAQGDINLTDELIAPEFEEVTLTDEDLRILEARFGRRITKRDTSVSRFVQALDLDLNVQIERDVWLRSDGSLPLDIEFRGNVRAVKAPYAEGTDLYGTVDVTRGTVETLGRRFEIERGRLVFNGPATETDIDLSAVLDIRTSTSTGTPSVQITLDVNGRLGDDLAVTLSSNPQLDNADIVSLIATGQLAEDAFGANAVAGVGGGLLYGQLAQIIEGAGSSLGFDVIQIDQTADGLVIRLGRYLTNKAFISVGQPLSSSGQANEGTQVTLEYALLRWLLAQLEVEMGTNGNSNSIGAGALYEYTY